MGMTYTLNHLIKLEDKLDKRILKYLYSRHKVNGNIVTLNSHNPVADVEAMFGHYSYKIIDYWLKEIAENDIYCFIFPSGTKAYFKIGVANLHREDGPALIFTNGTYEYYFMGDKHREDGPAVVEYDGTKKWYRYGRLHREDGPAHITYNNIKYWYLDNKIARLDQTKPSVQYPGGQMEWWVDGEYVLSAYKTPTKFIVKRYLNKIISWFTIGKRTT